MTQNAPTQLPEERSVRPAPEMTILPVENAATGGQRSGCWWGLAGALGCLLMLLIPLVVVLLVGGVTFNSLVSNITSLFAPRPLAASVISTQTILTGIQPMGQLVSVSTQLAKADIGISIQQGTLNACGFSANHVAQGTVEAGIDLTQVSEADLHYDAASDTYTAALPPAQLTSCRIDFIRQYDRSLTACAVDWDEARLLANYEAVTQFRADALEGGITTRAQEEARLALGNFIHLLTGSNVKVIFKDSNETILPASCTPDSPSGWLLDPVTHLWSKP